MIPILCSCLKPEHQLQKHTRLEISDQLVNQTSWGFNDLRSSVVTWEELQVLKLITTARVA